MAIDPMWIWVALGAVAVLAVVWLFMRGARKSRSESLRDKFGSEYDHAVRAKGWKKGERELIERKQEVEQHPIRALTQDERERFRRDWERVERHFIERPTTAVVEADETVAEIMRAQGYPMGDFEKHAANLSVTHPRVVHHYRSGHKVIGGAPGSASTEDLRQAMLHYRALFEEIVNDRAGDVERDVRRDVPRDNEVSAPRPASGDVHDERGRRL